jgi:hypothetical protein
MFILSHLPHGSTVVPQHFDHVSAGSGPLCPAADISINDIFFFEDK